MRLPYHKSRYYSGQGILYAGSIRDGEVTRIVPLGNATELRINSSSDYYEPMQSRNGILIPDTPELLDHTVNFSARLENVSNAMISWIYQRKLNVPTAKTGGAKTIKGYCGAMHMVGRTNGNLSAVSITGGPALTPYTVSGAPWDYYYNAGTGTLQLNDGLAVDTVGLMGISSGRRVVTAVEESGNKTRLNFSGGTINIAPGSKVMLIHAAAGLMGKRARVANIVSVGSDHVITNYPYNGVPGSGTLFALIDGFSLNYTIPLGIPLERVGGLTHTNLETFLRFAGLNTIDGQPAVIDIFRARVKPDQGIPLINENLSELTMTGTLLPYVRAFGRPVYFEEKALTQLIDVDFGTLPPITPTPPAPAPDGGGGPTTPIPPPPPASTPAPPAPTPAPPAPTPPPPTPAPPTAPPPSEGFALVPETGHPDAEYTEDNTEVLSPGYSEVQPPHSYGRRLFQVKQLHDEELLPFVAGTMEAHYIMVEGDGGSVGPRELFIRDYLAADGEFFSFIETLPWPSPVIVTDDEVQFEVDLNQGRITRWVNGAGPETINIRAFAGRWTRPMIGPGNYAITDEGLEALEPRATAWSNIIEVTEFDFLDFLDTPGEETERTASLVPIIRNGAEADGDHFAFLDEDTGLISLAGSESPVGSLRIFDNDPENSERDIDSYSEQFFFFQWLPPTEIGASVGMEFGVQDWGVAYFTGTRATITNSGGGDFLLEIKRYQDGVVAETVSKVVTVIKLGEGPYVARVHIKDEWGTSRTPSLCLDIGGGDEYSPAAVFNYFTNWTGSFGFYIEKDAQIGELIIQRLCLTEATFPSTHYWTPSLIFPPNYGSENQGDIDLEADSPVITITPGSDASSRMVLSKKGHSEGGFYFEVKALETDDDFTIDFGIIMCEAFSYPSAFKGKGNIGWELNSKAEMGGVPPYNQEGGAIEMFPMRFTNVDKPLYERSVTLPVRTWENGEKLIGVSVHFDQGWITLWDPIVGDPLGPPVIVATDQNWGGENPAEWLAYVRVRGGAEGVAQQFEFRGTQEDCTRVPDGYLSWFDHNDGEVDPPGDPEDTECPGTYQMSRNFWIPGSEIEEPDFTRVNPAAGGNAVDILLCNLVNLSEEGNVSILCRWPSRKENIRHFHIVFPELEINRTGFRFGLIDCATHSISEAALTGNRVEAMVFLDGGVLSCRVRYYPADDPNGPYIDYLSAETGVDFTITESREIGVEVNMDLGTILFVSDAENFSFGYDLEAMPRVYPFIANVDFTGGALTDVQILGKEDEFLAYGSPVYFESLPWVTDDVFGVQFELIEWHFMNQAAIGSGEIPETRFRPQEIGSGEGAAFPDFTVYIQKRLVTRLGKQYVPAEGAPGEVAYYIDYSVPALMISDYPHPDNGEDNSPDVWEVYPPEGDPFAYPDPESLRVVLSDAGNAMWKIEVSALIPPGPFQIYFHPEHEWPLTSSLQVQPNLTEEPGPWVMTWAYFWDEPLEVG